MTLPASQEDAKVVLNWENIDCEFATLGQSRIHYICILHGCNLSSQQ